MTDTIEYSIKDIPTPLKDIGLESTQHTLSFVNVETDEQINNIIDVLRKEHRKVIVFSVSVDQKSYQPCVYLIAIKEGEHLSSGLKFKVPLSLGPTDGRPLTSLNFTNVPRIDIEAVKNVLEGMHEVESEDYKFIGEINS